MTGTWALNLFDRLHIGHQVLIDILHEMPEPVACVNGGELIGKELEYGTLIQPVDIREKALRRYLKQVELDKTIQVRTITKFEEFLEIPDSTTFVMFQGPCCMEIEERGLELRAEKLPVSDSVKYVKPVRAADGDKISSARIRKGEVDRKGRVLAGTSEPPRLLKETRRKDLKAPKGDIFSVKEGKPETAVVNRIKDEQPTMVISIGDVTTATLMEEGYTPKVRVIDGITKRGEFEKEFHSELEYRIYNPAAAIYPEAWSVMKTAIEIDEHSLIKVEGEEDLMGFPAALLAPLGSVMLYGQPDVGIVWVPVTQENKDRARNLLDDMETIS
ncbi:MAG: hypothetical protein BAJATHORv1_30315 [Candidatus Thorarchaeota archaeon]|nr:MAG: hypothetical protein BAJATHORv1_30315 [Candidatus Thorarchaeota archaeon]